MNNNNNNNKTWPEISIPFHDFPYMDGVKWNVRVFAEGWMEWNEIDMDPHVDPCMDLRAMDWNPAPLTGSVPLAGP
jgi:hypothetical protein